MNDTKPKVIAIVGPTASGKSNLAVEIAKKFNGEIISADSRQVYKGLDIGSAKVPLTAKDDGLYYQNIRHHLLDIKDPKEQFTVAEYKSLAQKTVEDILKRKKLPIIAGGTGFYIDSLIYNLPIPEVAPQKKLRANLSKKEAGELYEKLKKLDPERAGNIHRNNKQRIIRALEIIETTGNPIPKISKSKPSYDTLFIGLKVSRKELKKRIEERLKNRLRQGCGGQGPKNNLLEEVEHLHKEGLSWERLESFGLEYRFVSQYLQGKLSKEERDKKIISESYKYAKRQMTWFKRNKKIHWINSGEKDKAFNLVQKFLN